MRTNFIWRWSYEIIRCLLNVLELLFEIYLPRIINSFEKEHNVVFFLFFYQLTCFFIAYTMFRLAFLWSFTGVIDTSVKKYILVWVSFLISEFCSWFCSYIYIYIYMYIYIFTKFYFTFFLNRHISCCCLHNSTERRMKAALVKTSSTQQKTIRNSIGRKSIWLLMTLPKTIDRIFSLVWFLYFMAYQLRGFFNAKISLAEKPQW